MKKKIKVFTIVLSLLIVLGAVIGVIYNEIFGYKVILPKETHSISESNIEDLSEFKMIAHRGFSAIAPENTLPAFEEACKKGFYGVEFDIQLSKDGEWFVIHNDSVKNMTGKNKKISEMYWEQIMKLEVINGANIEKYEDVKIPTLEETLELLSKYDVVPVIEIKTETDRKIDELMALLEKYELAEKSWIISFNEEPLKAVKKINSDMKISYLVNKIKDEDIELVKENDFTGISFNHKKVKEEDVKKIIDAGLVAQTWTVDDLAQFEKFASYGVRLFTGNCLTPARG